MTFITAQAYCEKHSRKAFRASVPLTTARPSFRAFVCNTTVQMVVSLSLSKFAECSSWVSAQYVLKEKITITEPGVVI